MTKIVCNYEVVRRIAQNIKNTSNDMVNTTTNLQSTVTNDLTTWQGTAHSNFINEFSNQTININNNVGLATALAEHLNDAVSQIEALEDELAAIKI